MSLRDDILAGLRAAESGSVGDETPEELLAAYRAEVLNEAANRLASTNPDRDVDFSDGVDWSVETLRGLATEGGAR